MSSSSVLGNSLNRGRLWLFRRRCWQACVNRTSVPAPASLQNSNRAPIPARPFVNPSHSPVAWAAAISQYSWVDALSVVTHNQTKNVSVITDLGFDPMCASMLKCISQQLSRDSKISS